MEKFTEFNDPVTGINPYIRIVKHNITVHNLIFSLTPVRMLFCLFSFLYKYITGSFACIRYANAVCKQRAKKNKVFLSTYSSIFDSFVLYRILSNPTIYIIKNTKVFTLSKYNVIKELADKAEVSRIIESGKTVVFLMGGGITNGKIYANPAEIEKIADIQQVISLRYTPDTTYDINLLNLCILPQFTSYLFAFFYHFLYFIGISKPLVCTVLIEDTLQDLSEKTQIEISTEIDSKTTEKFLKKFYM